MKEAILIMVIGVLLLIAVVNIAALFSWRVAWNRSSTAS